MEYGLAIPVMATFPTALNHFTSKKSTQLMVFDGRPIDFDEASDDDQASYDNVTPSSPH